LSSAQTIALCSHLWEEKLHFIPLFDVNLWRTLTRREGVTVFIVMVQHLRGIRMRTMNITIEIPRAAVLECLIYFSVLHKTGTSNGS
jgi:hypothetical protein